MCDQYCSKAAMKKGLQLLVVILVLVTAVTQVKEGQLTASEKLIHVDTIRPSVVTD